MISKIPTAAWIILAVIAIILIWGIIGGFVAADSGITCDMGIGDNLCWKWHKNLAGQVAEFFKDMN